MPVLAERGDRRKAGRRRIGGVDVNVGERSCLEVEPAEPPVSSDPERTVVVHRERVDGARLSVRPDALGRSRLGVDAVEASAPGAGPDGPVGVDRDRADDPGSEARWVRRVVQQVRERLRLGVESVEAPVRADLQLTVSALGDAVDGVVAEAHRVGRVVEEGDERRSVEPAQPAERADPQEALAVLVEDVDLVRDQPVGDGERLESGRRKEVRSISLGGVSRDGDGRRSVKLGRGLLGRTAANGDGHGQNGEGRSSPNVKVKRAQSL